MVLKMGGMNMIPDMNQPRFAAALHIASGLLGCCVQAVYLKTTQMVH